MKKKSKKILFQASDDYFRKLEKLGISLDLDRSKTIRMAIDELYSKYIDADKDSTEYTVLSMKEYENLIGLNDLIKAHDIVKSTSEMMEDFANQFKRYREGLIEAVKFAVHTALKEGTKVSDDELERIVRETTDEFRRRIKEL